MKAFPPIIPGIVIESELGRGAHSVVFRATAGGHPCAVKLPRSRARWTRWVHREAVSLARVRHPCLPKVLEVGEVDDLPYLVMDLVVGETLATHLASASFDEPRSIDLAEHLLGALAAVHGAGLVHRDVKPRNIVIEADGELPKLVDFGFAAPIERTGHEELAGTEAYAAPEQLEMPARVDGRADLFALGRVLFDCLTATPGTHRLRYPVGADARGELVAHGVSAAFADLIEGLLRRRADDRYPDALAVLEDLARVRAGMPVRGPRAYEPTSLRQEPAGRESELAQLIALCRETGAAAPAGEGALAIVRGQRGAGKTRLLRTLAADLRPGARVIEVACERNDAPFATLARVLDAAARTHAGAIGPSELRAAVGNLAPIVSVIAPSQVATFGPGDAALGTEALPEAAAEILVRIGDVARDLVLVVDDAHWLDPASSDALERLVQRFGESPIRLVLGLWDSDVPQHVLRLESRPVRRRLDLVLRPLITSHVRAIVCSHLGTPLPVPGLAERVAAMANGTPLGVLEVLGLLLDEGAVRPSGGTWSFDPAKADQVVLPNDLLGMLRRRFGELSAATRRVLEYAAVIDGSIEDELLAKANGLTVADLGFATAAAVRAGLLFREGAAHHRFVHESLREAIVGSLDADALRHIHQELGELLDAERAISPASLFRVAHHYAAGVLTKNTARTMAVLQRAVNVALERFDNETALTLLEHVRSVARNVGTPLPADFHRCLGEAQLRLGLLDDSLASFELAVRVATDRKSRAAMLGRLAWVHQVRAEPDLAWQSLGSAFSTLGANMPVESVGSAMTTTLSFVRSKLGREPAAVRTDEVELLCELHYQNARLGLEYGKPLRLLQSSVENLELSKRLPNGRMRVRASAIHGFVIAALKMRGPGMRELERAQVASVEQHDPATTAFCLQLRSTAGVFTDDLEGVIQLSRECIDTYGPWLELNEFCMEVFNPQMVEALRGRSLEAWSWLEKAFRRVRRSRMRPAMFEYIVHCARAALAAMGRDVIGDPWLAMQLAAIPPTNAGQGLHRIASWGPRARYYVERGELGEEFEALVSDFASEGHDPRTVHPVVAEYYIAIVHARMHRCLVAPSPGRNDIELLRAAAVDVRKASKALRLTRGHAELAEGCLAWLEGDMRKAEKSLVRAAEIGAAESAPWILYGVARLRAHILRRSGKGDAARDQARIAEAVATEHGAAMRARWIRDEFQLSSTTPEAGTRSLSRNSMSRVNRQLAALLQVARAPRRDLHTDEQAATVLDELIQILQASRGALLFAPEPPTAPISVGRAHGADQALGDATLTLLRAVHEARGPWPPEEPAPTIVPVIDTTAFASFDIERVAAVPLFLYDRAVGAVAIERAASSPPFTAEDRGLLVLLSHQVPIAIEIARLLFEREQLHASLQHAKKMEAMGALAGGLAHDFNNMLAAMRVALGAAQERAAEDSELSLELDIISQATTRAAQLTNQLLSFSRHQPVPVAVHEVNELISTLEPMLRRVVGGKVDVSVGLSSAVDAVEVDQGSFDQALVNLLINARDAMPNGGKITITTKNLTLTDSAAQRANVAPGEYVEIEIADTGEGMSQETMSRIFEPFFTTKAAGSGSGLGLAMVYAFARNCGGSIDVESEIGVGTKFRLYLRRVERGRVVRTIRPVPAAAAAGTLAKRDDERDTILVVDDDDLVRRSISKILERNGYRVLAANSSNEALRVVREQGGRIGLVILDVLMPGVTGPELGRRLYDLNLPAKLLFVSGFSPESIPIEEAQVAAEMLLQKPFSQNTLLERVRQLMAN